MLTSVPVAMPDPLYGTAVNTDLVISTTPAGIVNNDFDADGNSLSASVVANPANGSLISFNSNGTFTYRPNTSFTGIDTFTYKVSDGANDSNIATVSIAVGGNFGPRTNLDESPQNGMLLNGALTLSHPLTLGHELVYRSDTVDPHPNVVLETSLLSSSNVPDSIDARLTFNGVQESTVSYDNTDLSAGDDLRFVLQANASTLATGYYDWSIELKSWFGGNSFTRTYAGSQAVVNRSASEYGKGWWVAGLDQIYASGTGALLVKGNGDTLWFKSDGAGGYLKAPGDTSFATLVKKRGLIVIISDLLAPLDTLRKNLGFLRARGHELLLLRVLDPGEVEFPLQDASVIRDLETGREIYVDAADVRKEYARRFAEHDGQIRSVCADFGIDFARMLTDQPLERALYDLLVAQLRRGRTMHRAGGQWNRKL